VPIFSLKSNPHFIAGREFLYSPIELSEKWAHLGVLSWVWLKQDMSVKIGNGAQLVFMRRASFGHSCPVSANPLGDLKDSLSEGLKDKRRPRGSPKQGLTLQITLLFPRNNQNLRPCMLEFCTS
jgi:hypothetical protein